MYRIEFDTNAAAWIIQLQTLPFLWRTIRKGESVHLFPNYEAAVDYVETVGLNKVYRNYADRPSAAVQSYHPSYGYIMPPVKP
jgi:hypothetical protein